MAKSIEIRYQVDDGQAKKVADQQIIGLYKMQSEAVKYADQMEKSAAKAAAAVEKAAKKQADAQEKEAKRAADAADREAKRAADSQAREAKRAADAQAREAARLDAIVDSYLKKEYNDRVAYQKKKQELAEREAASLKGVGDVVLSTVAAYATFGTVARIIGGISQAWQAQRKDIEESVLRVVEYQEKLKELAQLKGGGTTAVLASQIGFRAQTTQSAEDARRLNEGVLNTGQVAVKAGFLNQAEMDKVAVNVGKFQAANGGDPNALGNLAGTVPGLIGSQGQAGDDVTRRLFNVLRIFEQGASRPGVSVSNFQATSALSKAGLFASFEEQAGVQSLLSASVPDAPGTRVEQFVRGTSGAIGRMRGMGIEGGEKQGEYLKSIGADPKMTSVQIGKLIASDIAAHRAADPQFPALDYLAHHGYGEQDSRLAVLDFADRVNSGEYAATFEKMGRPDAAQSIKDAMKPIDVKLRTDPTAQKRLADLAKDTADAARGMGPAAQLEFAQRQAFERLRGDRKTYGTYEQTKDNPIFMGQVQDEVQREIFARARKAGISTAEYGRTGEDQGFSTMVNEYLGQGVGTGVLGGDPTSRFGALGIGYTEKERAEKYAELEAKIGAKGGPGIDNSALMNALDRNTAATLKLEKTTADGMAKAPQPPPVMGGQPAPRAGR